MLSQTYRLRSQRVWRRHVRMCACACEFINRWKVINMIFAKTSPELQGGDDIVQAATRPRHYCYHDGFHPCQASDFLCSQTYYIRSTLSTYNEVSSHSPTLTD